MKPIRAIHIGGSAERSMQVLRCYQEKATVHVICHENLIGNRVFELTGGTMISAPLWKLDDDSLLRLRKVSFKLGLVIAQWTPPARSMRKKRGPKADPRQQELPWMK